jgi:hypothetical protein
MIGFDTCAYDGSPTTARIVFAAFDLSSRNSWNTQTLTLINYSGYISQLNYIVKSLDFYVNYNLLLIQF